MTYPPKSYAPALLELQAKRTKPLPQCRCVIYFNPPQALLDEMTEEQRSRYPQTSRCQQRVNNPDNPVCDDCQEEHWNEDGTSADHQLVPVDAEESL